MFCPRQSSDPYLAELEELIESYRAFATTVTLSTPAERAACRKLLKKTLRVVGPTPDAPGQEVEKPAPEGDTQEKNPPPGK